MLEEVLLATDAMINVNGNYILVNEQNSHEIGLNFSQLKEHFAAKTGRVILTNEMVKVRYNKEGKSFDFSTFDNVTIRVDYNSQAVAPNKGGDSFGD